MTRIPIQSPLHAEVAVGASSGLPPSNARLLGYSGAIPFALCAGLVTWGDPRWATVTLGAFTIYSAVILSFIGGIRWGAAISGSRVRTGQLVLSVIPSLWAAFFAWWPDESVALTGLMSGFILLGLADWTWPGLGMAAWMRPLRARLTLVVVVCHLAVIAAL